MLPSHSISLVMLTIDFDYSGDNFGNDDSKQLSMLSAHDSLIIIRRLNSRRLAPCRRYY